MIVRIPQAILVQRIGYGVFLTLKCMRVFNRHKYTKMKCGIENVLQLKREITATKKKQKYIKHTHISEKTVLLFRETKITVMFLNDTTRSHNIH